MPKANQNSEHIKISLRIHGKVTSITLKKTIVAFWLIYGTELNLEMEDAESLHYEVSTFVYKCLKKWKKPNGKGLSFFVTNKMVKKILEASDYKTYRRIVREM